MYGYGYDDTDSLDAASDCWEGDWRDQEAPGARDDTTLFVDVAPEKAPLWASMLVNADGRIGADSRESKRLRRERAFARTA